MSIVMTPERNIKYSKLESLENVQKISDLAVEKNSEFKKREQSPLNNQQEKYRHQPIIANDVVIAKEFEQLKGQYDLPSIGEFLFNHDYALQNKDFLKATFTNCRETLDIAQNILNYDKTRAGNLSYVLEQPSRSTKDLGSVKVLISSLADFADFEKIYHQHKHQEVMLCVGGPSASDQAVIAAMIPEISQKLDKIIFITRNYLESNVAHSAKQYHIRHANALNADPSLTGRYIIRAVIKRLIFGIKPKEVVDSSFLKIDVSPTLNLKTLKIYLGNEINAIKQSIREILGRLTEHDINRITAFLGGEFFKVMEEKMSLNLSGRAETAKKSHPTAIHVTFNEEEAGHAEKENNIIDRIKIAHRQLDKKEINKFFGPSNKIYKAYGYPSDTHVVFDVHGINRNFAEKNGVVWSDDCEIKRILLTKDSDGEPKVAGIIDQNGEFTYVSKLHFSGGYKVDYLYDSKSDSSSFLRKSLNNLENKFSLQKPLSNEITIATGTSVNAIFKKRENLGEISVTNSHWTKIAEDDEHMLVRITGGGNTGEETYNPAYALNVIANTRRIFGDDLVGIVSTYGCSRAVNSKNSTQFAKIAKGFVVSYGKGGTGNTKRHFEALKALHKLGFGNEIKKFCNQYKSERGGLLGNKLDKFINISNRDFSYDNSKKSARRLGFSNKISLAEIINIIVAAPQILVKLISKKSN